MTILTALLALITAAAIFVVGALVVRLRRQERDRRRLGERQRELDNSLSTYRSIFDSVTDLIYIQDPENGRFLDINRAVVETYGYSREEILGSTPALLADPERVDLDDTFDRFQKAAAGTPQRFEFWGRTKDGTSFPKEIVLMDGSFGGRNAVIAIARDVRARFEAAETIREKEEQYRALFEADLAGNFVARSDGSLEACNDTFAGIVGYDSIEEALANGLQALESATGALTGILAELRANGRIDGQELELRSREGATVRILLYARGVFEDGELVRFHGHCLDITEQNRLAERVRNAQKMEAVGLLAGGVAHDFNNALTTIQGHTELMLEDLQTDASGRENLDEIRQATARAARLTRKLLAFSRRRVLRPRVVDLAGIAQGSQELLERVLGEDIGLTLDCDGDAGQIQADPGEVEQVLINLLINAREALPGGGHVRVHVGSGVVPGDRGLEARVPPGRYVLLTVQDDGVGMDETVRARAFEPFFTTKTEAEGSGLGLATVYGVVREAGGHVWVDSELGRGATVTACFPRVHESVGKEEVRNDEPPRSIDVLLAEDESGVRRLARRVLEREGYVVHEAADGKAALDLAGDEPGRFALLVTDVVMPNVRGPELADRLRSRHPGLPVLFMSGYTESDQLRAHALQPGQAFLAKPFAPAAFRDAVRELLQGIAAGGPG